MIKYSTNSRARFRIISRWLLLNFCSMSMLCWCMSGRERGSYYYFKILWWNEMCENILKIYKLRNARNRKRVNENEMYMFIKFCTASICVLLALYKFRRKNMYYYYYIQQHLTHSFSRFLGLKYKRLHKSWYRML